jgi:hypothetical protein
MKKRMPTLQARAQARFLGYKMKYHRKTGAVTLTIPGDIKVHLELSVEEVERLVDQAVTKAVRRKNGLE